MLASGTLLQGRYLITRPIGRGGMAAVYEAVDSRLQNTVAVKQMTATGTESDRAFEHEAQLLAGLRHHALPVVIDYFIDADGHFLVMQVHRRRGPGPRAPTSRRRLGSRGGAHLGAGRARRAGLPARAPASGRAPRHQARKPETHALRRDCTARFRAGQGDCPAAAGVARGPKRVRLHAALCSSGTVRVAADGRPQRHLRARGHAFSLADRGGSAFGLAAHRGGSWRIRRPLVSAIGPQRSRRCVIRRCRGSSDGAISLRSLRNGCRHAGRPEWSCRRRGATAPARPRAHGAASRLRDAQPGGGWPTGRPGDPGPVPRFTPSRPGRLAHASQATANRAGD